MRRRVRLLSVLAFVALVASACRLDVGVDIAMQPDGSGTVTVSATADAELLAKQPSALGDLRLDDVKAAGWTVSGPTSGAGGSMTIQLTKPFRNPAEATAILAELNGPAGPLQGLVVTLDPSFARTASGLTGSVRLDGGLAAFSDNDLVKALGGSVPLADLAGGSGLAPGALDLVVTARFPGEVVSGNGTIAPDRASVSWTPPLDGTTSALDARFERVDQGALDARDHEHWARTGLVVWGGLVVLVAVVALAWFGLRRARVRVE